MNDDSSIPAANVSDVDLAAAAAVDPIAAGEIRQLAGLMEAGEETPEQFFHLVKLLHRAGCTKKAEYLLRRNLDVGEGGESLYLELFGTEKQNEFAAAICGFADQFSVELEYVKKRDFLDSVYRAVPRSSRLEEFELLRHPCVVRFDYANEDGVEAQVSSPNRHEDMVLRWVSGAWETVGPTR